MHVGVVDAASNRLVWERGVSGRVTDKAVRELEQTIDKAVIVIYDAAYPLSVP